MVGKPIPPMTTPEQRPLTRGAICIFSPSYNSKIKTPEWQLFRAMECLITKLTIISLAPGDPSTIWGLSQTFTRDFKQWLNLIKHSPSKKKTVSAFKPKALFHVVHSAKKKCHPTQRTFYVMNYQTRSIICKGRINPFFIQENV